MKYPNSVNASSLYGILMKLYLIIQLLILVTPVKSQSWWRYSEDTLSDYRFRYRLQMDDEKSIPLYSFDNSKKLGNSYIVILSNVGQVISDASVTVTNRENKYSVNKFSTKEGIVDLDSCIGNYRLTVNAEFYKPFNLDIICQKSDHFKLTIILAPAYRDTIYDIDSREELSETERRKILECIKSKGFLKCKNLYKYRIGIEI